VRKTHFGEGKGLKKERAEAVGAAEKCLYLLIARISWNVTLWGHKDKWEERISVLQN